MINKVAHWMNRNSWTSSAFITAFVFLLLLLISTPLLNSGDDTFLMYTMGGGYGEKPTGLLHYNHIWHPVLGRAVKSLFISLPGVNWYTVVLLLFYYAGYCCILYVLLKRCKLQMAVLFFMLLFLFAGARQLLSLNFTGASFTAATGGMSLLIHQLQQKEKRYGNIIAGALLVAAAGLLRLQVAWLVLLLFGAVAIVLLSRKQFLYWTAFCVFIAAALWGLNKQHERYYSRHIPGWKQEEKFRQALFYAYNRQLADTIPAGVFKDTTEQSLYFAGFLYDTTVFSTEHVEAISKKITRTRSLFNKEDRAGLYWFFIEMRVYLLLIAGIMLLLLQQAKPRRVLHWLLALLAFAAIHSYLFIFLKVTMPLHLGLLLYLVLALMLQFTEEDRLFIPGKTGTAISLLILAVATIWMGIRVYKENNTNNERYSRFLCAMKELNSDPEKLVIATDDAFPLNYFYIWNTPSSFPAANLIYKDRMLTNTCTQTLRRFSISSLQQALEHDPRVYLMGKELPALERGADSLTLTGVMPGYQCIELRQLRKKE